LDGGAGLEFALMFSWYEASIFLQAKALEQAGNRVSIDN
jgi:hypothetical protein